MKYTASVKRIEKSYFYLSTVTISKPRWVWEMTVKNGSSRVCSNDYATKTAAKRAGDKLAKRYQEFFERMGYPFERPAVLRLNGVRTFHNSGLAAAKAVVSQLTEKDGPASKVVMFRPDKKTFVFRGFTSTGDDVDLPPIQINVRKAQW